MEDTSDQIMVSPKVDISYQPTKTSPAESQTELFLELGICMDQHDHETHLGSSLLGLYFVFVYPLSFPWLKKEEVKITSGRIRCFFFQKKKTHLSA
jgi:hypothetical protein